ncbi:MAG: hypothetical protein EP336_01690 [Rhodobacteraceae bacterium]|nr:MAG: hypothetical protein EP336_01690 [Paracoccaceae bacterium]
MSDLFEHAEKLKQLLDGNQFGQQIEIGRSDDQVSVWGVYSDNPMQIERDPLCFVKVSEFPERYMLESKYIAAQVLLDDAAIVVRNIREIVIKTSTLPAPSLRELD